MSLMTALRDILSMRNLTVEVVEDYAVVPTGNGFVVLIELDDEYMDARLYVGTDVYSVEVKTEDVIRWIYIWTGVV